MRSKFASGISILLAGVFVVVTASPAMAAGDAAKPWHYWISFILFGGGLLLVGALGLGYYRKVVGGRRR